MYETKNDFKSTATKIFPEEMTHNRFLMKEDIVGPMIQFLNSATEMND